MDRVLEEARRLLDEQGVEGLTMRRLADRLGVAPNSLYSHHADKAALLDAVLDSLLAEIDVEDADRLGWQDGLVALMQASRATLLRHPDLFGDFMARPLRGPNIGRLAEVALAMFERGGIAGQAAVDGLRVLLMFTFGSVAIDAPRQSESDPAGREAANVVAFGTMTDRPLVRQHAQPLARPPGEIVVESGLRWLIAGIEGQVRA